MAIPGFVLEPRALHLVQVARRVAVAREHRRGLLRAGVIASLELTLRAHAEKPIGEVGGARDVRLSPPPPPRDPPRVSKTTPARGDTR